MVFSFFLWKTAAGVNRQNRNLAVAESSCAVQMHKESRSASVDTDRGIVLNPKAACSGLTLGSTVETVIERGVSFFVWPDFFQNLPINIGFFGTKFPVHQKEGL